MFAKQESMTVWWTKQSAMGVYWHPPFVSYKLFNNFIGFYKIFTYLLIIIPRKTRCLRNYGHFIFIQGRFLYFPSRLRLSFDIFTRLIDRRHVTQHSTHRNVVVLVQARILFSIRDGCNSRVLYSYNWKSFKVSIVKIILEEL